MVRKEKEKEGRGEKRNEEGRKEALTVHPRDRKLRGTKEPLDEGERGE